MRGTWLASLVALLASLLACDREPAATLPLRDDFAGPKCGWETGENDSFAYGCARNAYRWILKKPGPVHVTRRLGLEAPAIGLEVDATVVSGTGTQPGKTLFGIGCLAARGGKAALGQHDRGYLAIVKTDGRWMINRLDRSTTGAGPGFVTIAASRGATELASLAGTSRIGIDCSRRDSGPTKVRLFVNGREVHLVEDASGLGPFFGVALYADTFPGEVAF
jgi:hypothetical protein